MTSPSDAEPADPTAQIPLAIDQVGTGPAVVIVAGALCDRHAFAELAGRLAATHTVFTYDRRGRGGSGGDPVSPADADRAVGLELGDLSSVLDAATRDGVAPAVVGHSSGAVLACEAAAAGLAMSRLVAYEPPWAPDAESADPQTAVRIRELVEQDRAADAAAVFMLGLDATHAERSEVIGQPWFAAVAALAPSLTWDLALVDGEVGVPARMARITVPTLVLDGAASWPWIQRTAAAVAERIPGARHESLPDQEHAVDQAVLAPVLARFLAE